MRRALPLLLVALVVIGVLVLPGAPPQRLSALTCYELLALPAEGLEATPDEPAPPLWKVLLAGTAAERSGDGTTLRLGRVQADPGAGRLAAEAAGELLEQPVLRADGSHGEPLWQAILAGPAARREPAGPDGAQALVLRLNGCRHSADADAASALEDTYAARLALAAAFRRLAAEHPQYSPLVVEGEKTPRAGGANFEIQLQGDRQRIEVTVDGQAIEPLRAERLGRPEAPNDAYARRSLVRGLRELAGGDPEVGTLRILGEERLEPGGVDLRLEWISGRQMLYAHTSGKPLAHVQREWSPPDQSSLWPPVLAVALAILFRRPLLALASAVLLGSFLVRMQAGLALPSALGQGALDLFYPRFWQQLIDPSRAQTIGFVVVMLAMVGVMTRTGGIRGLVDVLSRLASSVRRTQLATWMMGLAVFFDDYANCVLVGTTMRPLSDRFRIAREKLAYLVDSTAAPVAGLSIFSTWIAFEVSTFSAQLPAAGLATTDGYAVFLETLPYRFYCLLTLVFVGLVSWTGRDFGPMLAAERRARRTGQLVRAGGVPMVAEKATALDPAEGVEPRAWRAAAPVLAFVLVTLFEIVRVGLAGNPGLGLGDLFALSGLSDVLSAGAGPRQILVGSLAGLAVAVFGALTAGLARDLPRAAWITLRSMGIALAILYLAWMIGQVCGDLGTAPYLTALASDTLDPRLLPALLFVLSAAISFATGTSWGTMSILLPLVVGLAYSLGLHAGLSELPADSGHLLMIISIGAVLEGSIFGDHCSPISDTTVLSSIASASDHLDHVRTQAPYALLVVSVALACGYLPATYLGLSPWVSLPLGIALLGGVLFVVGRRVERPEDVAPAAPR